jgi:uncharacterized membrane protein YhhN
VPLPFDPLLLFAGAVVAALLGVELRQRGLLIVGKPLATLALVPAVLEAPSSLTVNLVAGGLVLSAVGDAALLSKRRSAFMVGLLSFLVAHVLYAGAFLLGGGMGAAWTPLVGVVIFGSASGWLVRRMWGGLVPSLRMPLVIYTATCTAMASVALATLTGPWPETASIVAAGGGTLFFLSDANLAWVDFVEPYPHGQTVTLSLYWAGQLGITLAARWSGG